MAWFEVFIPSKESGMPGVTLTLEAPNWIGALRTGLQNLGETQESISNVMCDIKEDNSIHVTDVSSHRVFRLREVKKPSVAIPAPPPESFSTPPAAAEKSKPASSSDFSSSGPKTLLEFQRPDFSNLPSSTTPPPPPPDAEPASAPAPVPVAAPAPFVLPAPQLDAAKTAETAAPTGMSTKLDEPTGQSTIEMSVPWTVMPPPSQPLSPSVTVAPPSTKLPPPAPEAPPYDLTLKQVKAPASTSPTQKNYDVTLANPKAPSPSAVPSPSAAPAPAPITAPSAVSSTPPAPLPSTSSPSPVKADARPPKADGPSKADGRPSKVDEATERLPRAPGPQKKTGPVPAPTPRGTKAPPPKRPTGQFESAPQPVSREVTPESPSLAPAQRESAEAIADAVADAFDATQDLLLEGTIDPTHMASALLDIALAHIPAESGSFYFADVNGHELTFAAVRGPKAEAIKKGRYTVPVGQGIIGFVALEGICLRVTDMQKDPRYSGEVASAVGYAARDTLCASAEKDGRLYGAIQLINAKDGFTAAHMEVLRYIGLTGAQLLERHFERQ